MSLNTLLSYYTVLQRQFKLKNLTKSLIFLIFISLFSCEEVEKIPLPKSKSNKSKSIQEEVGYYKPSVDTTFYIQLSGKIRTDIPADLYIVDLFDTSAEKIKSLKSSGKKVICYFNGGAYEDWREDAHRFNKKDIGKKMKGWEGEYWLNIRSEDVRKIMIDRIKLAKDKGCDGIDPDNVNGYKQKTGFKLTYKDQLEYNIFLSKTAHKYGLSISLKNDLEQIKDLVEYFDFAVNEECFQYNECYKVEPFVKQGKPVFNIEYEKRYIRSKRKFRELCKKAKRLRFRTLVLPLNLNGKFVYSCDYGIFR